MHRFFESPELLLVIAKEILGEEDSGEEPWFSEAAEDLHEGHCNILQFAFACKAFSGAAFDVLWRSVEFSSLFSVLPIQTVEENGVLVCHPTTFSLLLYVVSDPRFG
jgi:hypothetical protein